MNKILLLVLSILAIVLGACSEDDKDPLNNDGSEGMITMVTNKDKVGDIWIYSFKEGETITIDWGDGTTEEVRKTKSDYDEEEGFSGYETGELKHTYSNSNLHTITIKGNIKTLDCGDNVYNLISLDVSKCPALRELYCAYNNLTTLDVSKCTALTELVCFANQLTSLNVSGCIALTELDCSNNNFSEKAMNDIYNALPVVDKGKLYCGIRNDNGYSLIGDYSIAENKGWEIYTY